LGYDFRADDLPFSVPPTPLDRLAAAILVNRQNLRGAMMAMFTAYFDASGQKSDPFVVVSGYVANFQQWKLLETCWKDLHTECGVDLPFHMTDFAAACQNPDRYAKQKKFRVDYVRLVKDDPKAATQFLHRLAIAQVSTMHCGISCIIPMALYNEVSSLLPLDEVVTCPPSSVQG
jgi:hypothetical protein